jgi:hypothetical protein
MKVGQEGFRFSHDKRFKRVSFDEFLATAKSLCQIVSEYRGTVDIEVLTAEDHTTYNYTTTTFWSDEIEEALKNRKRYTFDELTQEVWDRSFNVQVTLLDEQDPKPFMICVSCDKYADAKRMIFYGQCLDEETHRAVVNEFRRSSFSYGIGDGMGKISNFDMVMGLRLTGMRSLV